MRIGSQQYLSCNTQLCGLFHIVRSHAMVQSVSKKGELSKLSNSCHYWNCVNDQSIRSVISLHRIFWSFLFLLQGRFYFFPVSTSIQAPTLLSRNAELCLSGKLVTPVKLPPFHIYKYFVEISNPCVTQFIDCFFFLLPDFGICFLHPFFSM